MKLTEITKAEFKEILKSPERAAIHNAIENFKTSIEPHVIQFTSSYQKFRDFEFLKGKHVIRIIYNKEKFTASELHIAFREFFPKNKFDNAEPNVHTSSHQNEIVFTIYEHTESTKGD